MKGEAVENFKYLFFSAKIPKMLQKNKTYSSFTIKDIEDLGISFGELVHIFDKTQLVQPSEWLLETLRISVQLSAITEKAKSENYITPILMEVKRKNIDKFTFLSGCEFNVDESKGLRGFCDYILVKSANTMVVQSPILSIVEAKFDAVQSPRAIAQCIAEMYAAQQFNIAKKTDITTIFGIVTNADEWLFLKLEGNKVLTEQHTYSRLLLPELLGTLQQIIDFYL
jgi:hypothetical protein